MYSEPLSEVMDKVFDDKLNFMLGVPIKVIPSICRGESIRSWDKILTFLVSLDH